MSELVGLVIRRQNVGAEGGLQRSTLTLDRLTLDGEPFDGTIDLASRPVTSEVAYATLNAISDRGVVVIEASPSTEAGPWELGRVLAISRNEDPRLEAIASAASAARHPNDIVSQGNDDYLVPDIFREEPLALPGIGLAWARYSRRDDLCFVLDGWFTDVLEQSVMPVDGLEMWVSDDSDLEGVAATIRNFVDADASLRESASPYVFAYYQDVGHEFGDEPGFPKIGSAKEVWDHVTFRAQEAVHTMVDGNHYIVLEADCDWEPEHGLQLVFANGDRLCRVSPYDGEPQNSDPTVIFEPTFGPAAT